MRVHFNANFFPKMKGEKCCFFTVKHLFIYFFFGGGGGGGQNKENIGVHMTKSGLFD